MQIVYLTRRNLLTLLSKLDRNKVESGVSQATLIKRDRVHPIFPCTDEITVTAVEDEDYYVDRAAGEVFPLDLPRSHTDAEPCNCVAKDLWGCMYK